MPDPIQANHTTSAASSRAPLCPRCKHKYDPTIVHAAIDGVLAALEQRAPVKRTRRGTWRTRCPNPDHPDRHPSFVFLGRFGGRCLSRCAQHWTLGALVALLDVPRPTGWVEMP